MNNNEYIRLSLELHLFFARIMKEHSLFLEASFTEKDNDLKKVARDFQKAFSNILNQVIDLADGNISNSIITANEIVTKNTLNAEAITSNLTGGAIDSNITKRELQLRSGTINVTNELINSINSINLQTLPLINNLIEFKNDVLNSVLSC